MTTSTACRLPIVPFCQVTIASQARVITFHSPMPMHNLWQGEKPAYTFAAESFRRAVFADLYHRGETGYTVAVPDVHRPVTLVGGTARGRLLGGIEARMHPFGAHNDQFAGLDLTLVNRADQVEGAGF